MTLWLLGSKAAQIHSLPFERTIRDEFDLIGTEEDLVRLGATHLRDNVYTLDRAGQTYTLTFDHTSPSNQLLMQQTPADVYSFFEFQFNVPSKGILYETKRSHANYNYRFDETLDDLIVMKRSGWHEEAEFGEYYTQRRNEAKELYPHPERKRVDISKVSHEKLFAEQKTKPVRHDFWHDDIHEATCRYESPLYTKCKYNQSSPLLDRGLTEQLSLEDQIILAQEECLVLYLESSYINTFLDKKIRVSPSDALPFYQRLTRRVMSRKIKGWFQDFMIDNAEEILKLPNWDFTSMLWEAYDNGKLREINPEIYL